MLVSVIIPIFNSSATVGACLHSILLQTWQDWECILVDDGSNDGSGEICDCFVATDSRFIVIHQVNKGVSAARNKGIEVARGSYVAFIDSDDFVSPDYLIKLLEQMDTAGADLAVCGMTIRTRDGQSLTQVPPEGSFSLGPRSTARFLALEKANLLFSPFLKLYRRELIEKNRIRFDESRAYGEDLDFNLQYLACTDVIAVVSETLYTYQRAFSKLSTRFRPDMFVKDYGQWKCLMAFHINKGLLDDSMLDYLFERLWGIVYDGLFLYPHLDKPPKNYLRDILAIPEIDSLRTYDRSFACAAWIKRWILHRRYRLFYLYFNLLYRR